MKNFKKKYYWCLFKDTLTIKYMQVGPKLKQKQILALLLPDQKIITLRLCKIFQLAQNKTPWQVQVYILKSGEQVGYFDEKKEVRNLRILSLQQYVLTSCVSISW
jgi:hypothetical protein